MQSTSWDPSAPFQTLERPRLPSGRPTGVSTSSETRVCGIFHTCTRDRAGTVEHMWRENNGGRGHAQPVKARCTACATPRQPRGFVSQRRNLTVATQKTGFARWAAVRQRVRRAHRALIRSTHREQPNCAGFTLEGPEDAPRWRAFAMCCS